MVNLNEIAAELKKLKFQPIDRVSARHEYEKMVMEENIAFEAEEKKLQMSELFHRAFTI